MPSMVEEYNKMKDEIPVIKAEIEAYKLNVKDLEEKILKMEQEKTEIKANADSAISELKSVLEKANASVEIAMKEKIAAEEAQKSLSEKLQLKAFDNVVDGRIPVAEGGETKIESPVKVDHAKKLQEFLDAGDSKGAIAYYRLNKKEIEG